MSKSTEVGYDKVSRVVDAGVVDMTYTLSQLYALGYITEEDVLDAPSDLAYLQIGTYSADGGRYIRSWFQVADGSLRPSYTTDFPSGTPNTAMFRLIREAVE